MPAGTSTVYLYTDGACSGNPGKGGWAALLRYKGTEKILSGVDPHTTNNRMELTAVIKGLEALKRKCKVHLTTDSQYVQKGATEWIEGWARNGWRNASKKPVLNSDLWQNLYHLIKKHDITWHWVKGHDGHKENELVDKTARDAISSLL